MSAEKPSTILASTLLRNGHSGYFPGVWMTLLALFVSLLAFAWALVAHVKARRALSEVWTALRPLISEADRAETRRFELENELDARIKRLLARETYWRNVATERGRSSPDETDVGDPVEVPRSGANSESPLDLRRRLRGAG